VCWVSLFLIFYADYRIAKMFKLLLFIKDEL